jgi:Capsule polysaccharide biosynthesis protein
VTRILVFSPYALWTSHTVYEEVIAKVCQSRGAVVDYLLCDGLLPECDQHWDSKANAGRPQDLCQRCKATSKANLENLGFPYNWLGDFVNQRERQAAFVWAHSVPPAELREAVFEGAPLGNWVLASVISYFRQYPPDINNWRVVTVYRGFLMSAAIVATGIRNYLKEHTVDAALLFNGRQSITRVALELFRERGIRVLTHERAEYLRGHVNVKPNAHCMSMQPFKELWAEWCDVPLDRKALEFTLQWLIQRRYGANLAWIPFNKSFGRDSTSQISRNPTRKHLWALFTSSTDEVAGDPQWQGPYRSQAEWVSDVVRWVAQHNDVELVIKVHPNLGGNYYIGKATDELRTYQQMQSSLPPNVRLVLPDDAVNAYALTDAADVGLTFGSTIGLEMAMLGKPVLLASRALYEYGSQIWTLRSQEDLPEMLERCLQATINREIQRQAFRLAHRYLSSDLPFPAVSVYGIYDVRVNDAFRENLSPGTDGSLDCICDFLIKGQRLYKAPTAAEQMRSISEEDAFFDELARSPDKIRNIRYERWLRLKSFGRATKNAASYLPFGAGDALVSLGRRNWHALLQRVESGATRPH